MCDRFGYFGKNPHQVKITKNGPKRPKSRIFKLFKKIRSLALSGFHGKWKLLWFIKIMQKLCKNYAKTWLGKICSSCYNNQKCLLANKILVFFNRQYFTNRLISDFDFYHVDRHK